MYNVVFLGAPGAGKGTQAAIIARKMKLAHIATGDLFRQAIEAGNKLGKIVKKYMEKGELVPDSITIKVILERMSKPDTAKGAIFDGFPRNLSQAEALDKALKKQNKGIDKVVYIKVSEDELVRRLSERWVCRDCQRPYAAVEVETMAIKQCCYCDGQLYQRPDDRPETVKKRLEVYITMTSPLIDYYKKDGKLLEVDGHGGVARIADNILTVIDDGKN